MIEYIRAKRNFKHLPPTSEGFRMGWMLLEVPIGPDVLNNKLIVRIVLPCLFKT